LIAAGSSASYDAMTNRELRGTRKEARTVLRLDAMMARCTWNGFLSREKVGLLHEEGAELADGIPVSSRAAFLSDLNEATWLVVGHVDVIRIWGV
jgi:hypothetical protein